MKSTGKVNIFSIGIDIGGQSIRKYINDEGSYFSVVDRETTNYEIGDADNTQAYAQWLGSDIAGGPKLTAQAHRYAAGNNPQQLEVAFANILNDIKATSGLPMTQAIVTDPMGEDVEFLYFHSLNNGPSAALNGTSKLSSTAALVDGNATYNRTTDTITWDILKSGFTIEATDSDGARTVHYEIKYRVRLENEPSSYNANASVKTNDGAVFEYQTIEPDGSSTHNSPLSFPDPEVKGYKGAFSFKKVEHQDAGSSSTPDALPGAVFELKHADNCSECTTAKQAGATLGKTVAINPMYATSNGEGVVSFANIPSGHNYILLENSAPIGYQLSSAEYPVSVTYGSTTVKNGDNWETWSADTPQATQVTNKKLLPCEVEFAVSKNLSLGDEAGNAAEGITPDHGAFTFELQKLDTIKDDSSDPSKITGFSICTGSKEDPLIYQSTHNHGTAAEFETIHFEKDGDYYYMISETTGSDNNIKYDSSYYIARVTVTGSNADHQTSHYKADVDIWKFSASTNLNEATLSGNPIYDENTAMGFTNVKSKPAAVSLPVIKKTLDDKLVSSANQYAFQLKDKNGNVLQTISNNAGGSAEFDPLTFETAGTYNYTISEVVGDSNNIYYDETVYNVVVTVTSPTAHSGAPFVASVTVDGKNAPAELPFANTSKTASLAMHATKIVDGDKLPTAGKYSFDVHAVQKDDQGNAIGQPAHILTGSNDGTGLVSFAATSNASSVDGLTVSNGVLTFNKAGVYYFHVSEAEGNDPTVLYDSTVHEITVVVSDDENKPTFSVIALDDGAEIDLDAAPANADIFANSIDFSSIINNHKSRGTEGVVFPHFANSTRHASVDLGGVKTLDRKTPVEGAFSFELKDAEGKVIETVANDAEGRFTFAPISLNWDSAQGANNQHVYYISEVIGDDATISYDKTLYRVTVVLEDPALTDPGLPIPATVKYEQVLDNGNYESVDSPDFNNKTKPVIPATGDSPLPWVLCGVAFAGLALAFVAFRKTRRS